MLKSILTNYRQYGCFSVTEGSRYISVGMIDVEKQHRGRGIAKAFFSELFNYADEKQKPVILRPSGFEYEVSLLIEIYSRIGFKQCESGKKMIRNPKTK
jgi:predicted GNAT superfamily acetyltransferase